MTREELVRFNGRDGKPAYVAVAGIVYDVSSSPLWDQGTHEKVHQAGCDLTAELKSAPHIAAVVERFPSVDRLTEQTTTQTTNNSKLAMAAVIFVVLVLAFLLFR